MFRKTLPSVILFFIGGLLLAAEASPSDQAPEISSPAAVLIDAATGEVLYEKNGDLPHPPASLVKVMTMHLLLEKISRGELSLDDSFSPPADSWASNQPYDASLMFLGPDQKPRVRDVLLGMAVSSGNDAAYAAAHLVSGSVENFKVLMNAEASRLGLEHLHFVEPSGYDENNRITARDFARFLKYYLDRHPESLSEFHSLREFTYPRAENILKGNGSKPITQHNKNSLLYTYDGADGIKTGFLYESGYNLAGTAKHGSMRLILVLLGARGATPRLGILNRNLDAQKILDYGFDNFTTFSVESPSPKPVGVWKGEQRKILPLVPDTIPVTIKKGRERFVTKEIIQKDFITAPAAKGMILGTIRILDGEKVLYQQNLVAEEEVAKGPWYRVFIDTVTVFLRKVFGYPV